MKREDFVHVLQAAAAVVDDELVIVGSQAILGAVPDPPEELLRSSELDVYPRSNPSRAIEIDGAIGDGSRFHELYGYYAHGVGPETITAPAGWEGRLLRLEAPAIRRRDGEVVGWCLSPHDLMLAKLAAGRPHDVTFVETALATGLVSADELRTGIDLMPKGVRTDVRERLEALAAKLERQGTD